ncbi:MAG: SDR family NAD(P)-dependent oxidoreductase [Saprospiraceae bacterium]|nr:SDR family NAD(P)-dependent oxidoreductase [Saprospiraceae bacterium]
MNKTILVTGANSGLGKAMTLALSEAGHRVFAAMRDTAQNPFPSGGNIDIVRMDVCDDVQIAEAVRELKEKHRIEGLDVLINNAGAAMPGPLERATRAMMVEQFNVNVFSVISVSNHFLPLLKARRGKILNVGSMSSRMAIPFVGLYGASKAALKQVSWALRLELRAWHVEVCHLELGNFPSAIWDKASFDTKEWENDPYRPFVEKISSLMQSRSASFNAPELLCRKVLHLIGRERNPFNTVVGRDAKLRRLLTTLAPFHLLERLLIQKICPSKP